jgi:hypothetical protein
MAYRIISHEVHSSDGTYNAVFSDFRGSWSDSVIGCGDTLDLRVDIGASTSTSVTLSHRFISNLNLIADTGVNINMNGGVWRGTLISTYLGVSFQGAGTWLNQHADLSGGRTRMTMPETVTLGGVGDMRISHGARMEFIGAVGADQAVDLATNGSVVIDHLSTFHASVHLVGEFEHISLMGTLADAWAVTDLPGAVDRLDFYREGAAVGSLRLSGDVAPHVAFTAPGVIDITGGTLGV